MINKSVFYYFEGSFPHGMAMAKRLFLYADALNQKSVKQLVYAANPSDSDIEGYFNYRGVSYINSKKYFKSSKNFVLKRFGLLISKFSALFKSLYILKNYDVIFYVGESWSKMFFFKIICTLFGKKIIIELNEHPYITFGDRRLNFKAVSLINQWISLKIVYRFIDGFIVISENLKILLNENGIKDNNILKVPILVDSVALSGSNDRFAAPYLFHAGTLNENKDGIISVFQAYAEVVKLKPEVKFILTNRTTIASTLNKIDKLIKENKIEKNVVFLNHISNEEVIKYMQNCSFAIINKPYNKQNYYNFSTKLGEYLINEVPLITTVYGESKEFLVDRENVLSIEPDDVEGMVFNMKFILSNQDAATDYAKAGRKLASNTFVNLHYTDQINKFINNV